MREAKDTLLRQLALLWLIPREAQRRATTILLEKMRRNGFSVSSRTLLRDLENLLDPFALQCETQEAPCRWSFARNVPVNLAAMDMSRVLALFLAENHLKSLLPQIVLDHLGPQFNRARSYLIGAVGGYSDARLRADSPRDVVVGVCCRRCIFDPGADAMLTQPSSLKSEMQQRVRRSKLGQ